MHMISIKSAQYQQDYQIFLLFNDDTSGVVDFRKFLFEEKHTVFKRLRDINQFKNFLVDYTIIWGDDLDLAPEFLHDLLIKQNDKK